MGIENAENAESSLNYVKEELGADPEIIIHDFSPNLIKATCSVFGAEKMGIDPFHVMQMLNRAIRKELNHFRKENFAAEEKELIELRGYISSIQRELKDLGAEYLKNPPKLPDINKNHKISKKCCDFTSEILGLLTKECTVHEFYDTLRSFLSEARGGEDLSILSYVLSIEEKLPKKRPSDKFYLRTLSELLKKLKTLYSENRIPIEDEKKRFSRQSWSIFFQPEKLTDKRKGILDEFLETYPSLSCYRDLTLRIGSLYRLPLESIISEIIFGIEADKNWGDELKACIDTFKRYHAAILRFQDFYNRNPDLPKRCRANMEYRNTGIKKVIGSGNNLKSVTRISNEIQLQFGGIVRDLLIRI